MKKKKIPLGKWFLFLPAEIMNDEDLSANDVMILGAIIQLDKDEKGCTANNYYLSRIAHCKKGTVSRSINRILIPKGYIKYNKKNEDGIYVRRVRDDLKMDKALRLSEHSKLSKKIEGSYEKRKDIYEDKKEVIEETKFNDKKEWELVEKLLDIPFLNKWKFYESCKKTYKSICSILWDEKTVADLIKLCTKLYYTFIEDLKSFGEKKQMEQLLKILNALLSNKPKFFKDSLPFVFVRFWNKAINEERFQRQLSYIVIKDRDSEETF
ncbi:hypothetical protein LK994_12070 [Ferruginibacter lapsinanis]|uniref:hypothetical protein n=1 Tax=Ferruginibacter lapsinanis TaxID=563172 RepID=UPI001E468462|nr:hypothetical protein [Ferruginibacter lapsinanis]UEG49368.1 hypothetical protein LK994_12070 [Ferruginibacter lapsinanis]